MLLSFLPLLAPQILLNNFLSDIPAITIAGDNVDPEMVGMPRRWNTKFIRNYMALFGLVSRLLSSLRSFSKLYWSGGSAVSALAISSSPALFDAFFLLVLVPDPAATPSFAEIFSSVLVADPVALAPVPEIFSSVPVPDPTAPASFAEISPSVLVADPVALAPVPEIFSSVPALDPTAPASVVAAFALLPVVFLAVFVHLAAIFVSVPVSVLVPAVLVSAAQVPLAVSYSSHYPF